ncbi:cytochrome b561 and DOMON domain-containing protein [Canna indica]|uniref:Cytochrome b561 and DOMON domain-containing protein n=1 Tax=Canna indica TaxID=4628 RepID=A0AAQ3Q6A7_9LILI|nr:cytochrome b561 and DOMON domain-containing protein [Canna indica]
MGVLVGFKLEGARLGRIRHTQGARRLRAGARPVLAGPREPYVAVGELANHVVELVLVYIVGSSNTFPFFNDYLAQHKSMAFVSLTSPATDDGGDNDGDRDKDEGGEREQLSKLKHAKSSGGDAMTAMSFDGGLSLAMNHVLLTIIGRGILLPIGIAMVWFIKHCDPSWFYFHTTIEGVGFVVRVVGVLIGSRLERDLGEYGTHKVLDVFVLAFDHRAGTLSRIDSWTEV